MLKVFLNAATVAEKLISEKCFNVHSCSFSFVVSMATFKREIKRGLNIFDKDVSASLYLNLHL